MLSKILLINLDKSKERLALCEQRMLAAKLSFERISAVYGADLNATQIEQHYSKNLGWRSYYKELNVGEIGCYLSHRKAWQQIIDEKLDFAVILEDDFYLSGDLSKVMGLIGEIEHEWHYLKLAKHSRKRKAIHQIPLADYNLVTYDKVPARTCAQAVSFAGAELLLANSFPFGRPIDIDLQHWWEKKIKLFGIEPCPVSPDESMGSEIDKFAFRNQAQKKVLKDVVDKLRFLIANWLANKSRLKALNKL